MRASTDDILPSKRLCSIEEVISFLFGSANKFFLKTRFNFCFMDESDFTPIKYSINLMWPSIFCYFIPMFLVAIYPSNAFSRRMRLTLSTDTKLDKLHSSISWLTDIFGWSFFCSNQFTVFCCRFRGSTRYWSIQYISSYAKTSKELEKLHILIF